MCFFVLILLFSCSVSNGGPRDKPNDDTVLLRVNNSTGDAWVLRLGDWSDDLDARKDASETPTIPSGGVYDVKTLVTNDYSLWIRKGTSDFRLKFLDDSVNFVFKAGSEYELTVVTTDMSWTLTDGDTVILGSGSVVEYPDVPVVDPASIRLTSNKTTFLSFNAGIWTNEIVGRNTQVSSGVFSSNASTDVKMAEGSYDLWINYGVKSYPLMKDGSVYEFNCSSNGEYALAVTDLTNWSLTDQNDGTLIASGEFSPIGYAKNLPQLSSLYPSNGSTDVYSNKRLDWYSNYADTYDLYLDSLDGSTLLVSNLTDRQYYPVLECSTTYYWKIVARNNGGQTESNVQSFTTEPPLVATLVTDDEGSTNQKMITVDINFSVAIDKNSFVKEDLIVTGGAVIDVFGQYGSTGGYSVRLLMPSNDATVTLTLPAGALKDSSSRRSNTAASITFNYHHIPMGEVNTLKFEEDSSGLWALDGVNGQLIYVDPTSAVALYAWDLPYDRPVDMDLIGETLYIVYQDELAISRFSINGSSPENSFLEAGTFTIPLRSGETLVKAYDIAADHAGNRLFVAYRDSDWPDDHVVCVLSAVDGSVLTTPVVVGGNTSGLFLDYKAGKLSVAKLGISSGGFSVYDTSAGLSPSSVVFDEMENFLGRDGQDMDVTGSRVAILCSNKDIVSPVVNNSYVIYDLAIGADSFSYNGRWDTGDYCRTPQFSPDGDYLYILSRGGNKLMVWGGHNYLKVRDIAFPGSSDYGMYRVSPNGNYIVGVSYHAKNKCYKFYLFDDVRE